MALGKGLGSLIPPKEPTRIASTLQDTELNVSGKIIEVNTSDILVNPHQPRKNFNPKELEDLIESIKLHGIIQPLVVTKKGKGYELIAGERRLRSAKIMGLPTVPVIVRDVAEQQKLEIALIENIQRKQLNPLEEAYSYQRLINEFNVTQEEAARRVGKSRSSVANILRLLELPVEVQQAIMDEKISEGHARAIAALPTVDQQLQLLRKIIGNNITVRAAEEEVKRVKGIRRQRFDPFVAEYEEKLRVALGTPVRINKKGSKGSLSISFNSLDDFKALIDRLLS